MYFERSWVVGSSLSPFLYQEKASQRTGCSSWILKLSVWVFALWNKGLSDSEAAALWDSMVTGQPKGSLVWLEVGCKQKASQWESWRIMSRSFSVDTSRNIFRITETANSIIILFDHIFNKVLTYNRYHRFRIKGFWTMEVSVRLWFLFFKKMMDVLPYHRIDNWSYVVSS